MRRATVCALMLLAGCSRREVPEDLGERLARECASIFSAALKVKMDARAAKVIQGERDEMIFNCILQRGGALPPAGSEWSIK